MALPQIDQVEELATKYTKPQLQRMAQMGQIDPTMAVMAGMMIDRIVQANIKPPTTTVAQDIMQQPAVGMAALPAAQQPAPQPAQMGAPAAAPMTAPQPAMAEGGIASLPVPDSLYEDSYAGGGVIAFAAGSKEPVSTPPDYRLLSQLNDDERDIYYRTGKLPTRIQFPQGTPLGGRSLKDVPVWEDVNLGGTTPGMTSTDMLLGRYPTAAAPAVSPASTPATPPAAAAAPAANVAATTPTAPATPPVPPRSTVIPEAAKELTPEEFAKQQAAFGINDEWKGKVEALIEKMGASAGDREQAKNMALLQAGLGIMGGQSPHALQNIGEGAKAAVAQYSKDVKDIRTAERDADKLRIEVAKAEDAQKRGDFKAFQEHNEKAREYALKLRKAELDEKQTSAYVQAATRPTEEQLRQKMFREDPEAFKRYQESMRPGFETAAMQRDKIALEQINNALLTMRKDDPKRKELEAERQRILGRLSGTGPAVPPNVQSVIDKYLNKPQ